MATLFIKQAAGSADIKTIETLAKEIWTQHYTPIIGTEQVVFMLKNIQSEQAIISDIDSGQVYDIVYYSDIPCAYSAYKLDNNTIFLSKFYVKQNHRGKGIAREMLKRIEAYAHKHKSVRVWLKCNKYNTDSISAYKKLGFSVAEACITDIGDGFIMDDYVLEKVLSLP